MLEYLEKKRKQKTATEQQMRKEGEMILGNDRLRSIRQVFIFQFHKKCRHRLVF